MSVSDKGSKIVKVRLRLIRNLRLPCDSGKRNVSRSALYVRFHGIDQETPDLPKDMTFLSLALNKK